jgi:outer membrane protein assembly factor BamB
MKRSRILLLAVLSLVLPSLPALSRDNGTDPLRQWAQWRGPLGTGVAPHGDPPVTWSESKNIRWKLPIPGRGLSTPVIWGHRIFLTTAVPHGEAVTPDDDGHAPGAHDNMQPLRRQKFMVLAVNRKDGNILWQRSVRDDRPHEATHITGSWASGSAITDGERVYASFGSAGVYALDMEGELIWQTDLGDMQSRHEHGEGSSPALHGDTLIVNWDHQGPSSLFALDKRTGKQRWKVSRDEITSWSTPLVVEHGGRQQIIIAATGRVRGYDLESGRVVWECGGLSRNVVASPVAADGIVYVANSYDWQAMLAIRLADAQGDITNSDAIVWSRDRDTPYVPSPVLYDGALCFLKHNQGFLTCVRAKTGKPLFGPVRLQGVRNIFAAPVGSGRRLYIPGRDGATAVVKRSAPFELLALNQLDDSFSASPAVVGDELYLRGERHLYCIAEGAGK